MDGNILNYQEFMDHIKALRASVNKIKIQFIDILAEGNKVSTHHLVEVYKRPQGLANFEVFAIFTIENDRITKCDELTRLVSGSAADRDLGSQK